jgi:membrane fusion protein (multidrug efflux system)
MVKVLIACVLLLVSAGAAIYWADEKPSVLAGRVMAALKEAAGSSGPSTSRTGAASGGPESGPPPHVAVETATAVAATSTEDLQGIGTLQSDESVQIASEVAGRVTEIPLSEGAPVAAGNVLVKLDDALVLAEMDDTRARHDLAVGNLGRANSLAKSGNVTERARDEASTNAETTRAALELARVRLSKHTIRAPFSGIAGMRKVSPGAYITAGQPIVNLEKIDTLKIDFKLPELFLSEIGNGQEVAITVDALPKRTFIGTIYAIDPHIDVNGRAIVIRARLANPGLVLRPGLFARIRVKGRVTRNVLVIPEAAIVPRGDDKIVYQVRDGAAVEVKVTLGGRRNGLVEILTGLAEDALVVTAGQQKLKDGSPVEVVVGSNPGARGT